MKIKLFLKRTARLCKDHLPEILTVTGVGGQIASNVLFVRAAKKETEDKDLKHYILPTAVSAGSIVAIVASNRVSNEQKIGLVAAGVLSAQQVREYRKIVKENVDDQTFYDIEQDYAEQDFEKLMIEADAADETDADVLHKKTLYYFPQIRKMVRCTADVMNVAILNLNQEYSIDGEALISDLLNWIDKDILKNDPELAQIAGDYGWQMDPDDLEARPTYITINQYSRKLSSGVEVTFIYFMTDPLRREEWEDYYANYFNWFHSEH